MKFLRIALALSTATVALTIGYWIYGIRGANGPHAKVELEKYTNPMTIAVSVFDSTGAPVPSASIVYESYSGQSSPELTDAKGKVAMESGEREVIALYVEGKKVWETPYLDSFLLDAILPPPSCVEGLAFNVNLKAEHDSGLKGLQP